MKISYNWLQEYFSEKLPEPNELAGLITMHSYEVESVEKLNSDFVFDIDVLPNRAPDSFCHNGVAKEISAILNLPVKKFDSYNLKEFKNLTAIFVEIKSPRCVRYVGRVVENIKIKESPTWLKKKLEALGQRSINNIVDATNLIMLETGQPLHAFDLAKLSGNKVIIRDAKKGEKIMTLDNKEIVLDEKTLIIADGKYPLAIAGIKGGKSAEISNETTSLFLESANFDGVNIRETSRRIGMRTESSLRFEHSISPVLAQGAMDRLTQIIFEIAKTDLTKVGEKIDDYKNPQKEYITTITAKKVSDVLGVVIKVDEIRSVLKRLDLEYLLNGEIFEVKLPPERIDLTGLNEGNPRPEYLVEEIGRIYGYEKIDEQFPRESIKPPKTNKRYFYSQIIKEILIGAGFSEVYNYSITGNGDVLLANPMAEDKKALRKSLVPVLKENIKNNLYNFESVKIFEFGTVFSKNKSDEIIESNNFCVAVGHRLTKKADTVAFYEVKSCLDVLFDELNVAYDINDEREDYEIVANNDIVGHIRQDGLAEINLDKLIPHIQYGNINYVPISKFPPIDRDISIFVTPRTKVSEVEEIIKDAAGELMVDLYLFDVFQKEDKKSFAFRLIFQSNEKTLEDWEVNNMVNNITKALEKDPSWQVRK